MTTRFSSVIMPEMKERSCFTSSSSAPAPIAFHSLRVLAERNSIDAADEVLGVGIAAGVDIEWS